MGSSDPALVQTTLLDVVDNFERKAFGIVGREKGLALKSILIKHIPLYVGIPFNCSPHLIKNRKSSRTYKIPCEEDLIIYSIQVCVQGTLNGCTHTHTHTHSPTPKRTEFCKRLGYIIVAD